MSYLYAGLLLLLAVAVPAFSDTQTLRGRLLRIQDPAPADATRRRVIVTAREPQSAHPLVGDPTLSGDAGGATLGIIARGAASSFQTVALPQGISRSGRPFWTKSPPNGFRYADRTGEQGPVRSVEITRGAAGGISMRAVLDGSLGLIGVVPPAPGIDGTFALALGSGDRYCAQYGPDGVALQNDTRGWIQQRSTTAACRLDGAFDALTYNVAGLPEGISGSHPATNTPLISPRLNPYDLVLVQESWQTPAVNPLAPLRVYHELLVADATHPYKSISALQPFNTDPDRPGAILGDGLNMMARFPFAPVVRQRWTNCFPSAADCLALKGFSMARTTVAPGVTVDVYDLHMEAGSAPEDFALRDQGITQLSTYMQTHSAGRAIIVGGDFNLHTLREPDGTQYARLLSEVGLTDACTTVGCDDPGRIDKFAFRSNAALELEAVSWRDDDALFRRPDGEQLSDHEPVVVRFHWTAVDD